MKATLVAAQAPPLLRMHHDVAKPEHELQRRNYTFIT